MAPTFSDMVITYFVCGAVMWATGFVEWDETGLADFFVSLGGGDIASANESIKTNLLNLEGPIGNVVNTLGGGLLAAWEFVSNLVKFWAWPIETLNTMNAPTEVVVIVGGAMTVAFTAAFITMIRGSA